jgi:hypothetical protein
LHDKVAVPGLQNAQPAGLPSQLVNMLSFFLFFFIFYYYLFFFFLSPPWMEKLPRG